MFHVSICRVAQCEYVRGELFRHGVRLHSKWICEGHGRCMLTGVGVSTSPFRLCQVGLFPLSGEVSKSRV